MNTRGTPASGWPDSWNHHPAATRSNTGRAKGSNQTRVLSVDMVNSWHMVILKGLTCCSNYKKADTQLKELTVGSYALAQKRKKWKQNCYWTVVLHAHILLTNKFLSMRIRPFLKGHQQLMKTQPGSLTDVLLLHLIHKWDDKATCSHTSICRLTPECNFWHCHATFHMEKRVYLEFEIFHCNEIAL